MQLKIIRKENLLKILLSFERIYWIKVAVIFIIKKANLFKIPVLFEKNIGLKQL